MSKEEVRQRVRRLDRGALVLDRLEQQRTRRKRAGKDRRHEKSVRILRAADLGRNLKSGSTER